MTPFWQRGSILLVMALDPFQSSKEKLNRADRHFQVLKGLVDAFVDEIEAKNDHVFTFEQEWRPRSHCLVWSIADPQPPNIEWGLVLGDILHNLRSALDHIAWSLVTAGKRPPETLNGGEQNAVKFPICKIRSDFNEAIKPASQKRHPCLPGVVRSQIALIRRHQPYRAGERKAHLHPLALLQQFSNDDKHRVLQLAFFRPYDPQFALGPPKDFLPRRVVPAKVIRPDPGTEILRVYGRRMGPNPYMSVDIGSPAEPAIEGWYWLSDTYQFARDAIDRLMAELAPTVS